MKNDRVEGVAKEVQGEFERERDATKETMRAALANAANLTVADVMTPAPTSVASGATAVDAARAMTTEDVGSLPVVDDDVLVGMVTDRDLVIHVLARDLDANKVPISDCCSNDPIVARPDEPLDAALQRMASEQVRRLPVVEEGRLVGIVAQADVARAAEPGSTGEMVEGISRH